MFIYTGSVCIYVVNSSSMRFSQPQRRLWLAGTGDLVWSSVSGVVWRWHIRYLHKWEFVCACVGGGVRLRASLLLSLSGACHTIKTFFSPSIHVDIIWTLVSVSSLCAAETVSRGGIDETASRGGMDVCACVHVWGVCVRVLTLCILMHGLF